MPAPPLITGFDAFTPTGIITILVILIVIWALLSLPVYVAAKLVTSGRATFPAAMGATLLGPIVYGVTVFLASFFLGTLIGSAAAPLALIIAFIVWLAVYKSVFSTGWLGALLIAILASIIFAVVGLVIAALLGPMIPGQFFDVASF